MAGAVSQLLARLDESPAHVVGLSLGGCVALALAIGAPARVRSLTLVNTFARLRPAGWRGAYRILERMVLARRGAHADHRGPRGAEPLSRRPNRSSCARRPWPAWPATTSARTWPRCAPSPASTSGGELAEIRCPTLIVAGDEDTTVPRASAELLRRRIPDARLLVVPGSGHATPYDQPDLFNRLVLEFVSGN